MTWAFRPCGPSSPPPRPPKPSWGFGLAACLFGAVNIETAADTDVDVDVHAEINAVGHAFLALHSGGAVVVARRANGNRIEEQKVQANKEQS